METISKLLSVKSLGFLVALATIVLVSVYGVGSEWVYGAIVALYGILAQANASITKSSLRVAQREAEVQLVQARDSLRSE